MTSLGTFGTRKIANLRASFLRIAIPAWRSSDTVTVEQPIAVKTLSRTDLQSLFSDDLTQSCELIAKRDQWVGFRRQTVQH